MARAIAQTHPGALSMRCTLLTAIELIEDVGQVSFVDAGVAAVLNFELEAVLYATCPQDDTTVGWRIPCRILDEVPEYTSEEPGIEPCRSIRLLDHEDGLVSSQSGLRLCYHLFEKCSSMPG